MPPTSLRKGWIGEDVQNGVEARKVLKLIERFDAIQRHRYTKSVAAKYGLDFAKCIPVPQLRERARTDEKIRNYPMLCPHLTLSCSVIAQYCLIIGKSMAGFVARLAQ